ncbi:MAG: class I SAM-dependent methyltransferase [Waddliaceae bacterium]
MPRKPPFSKSNARYTLVDSGHQRKLERFGPCLIARPASQAIWEPMLPTTEWEQADAVFTREGACQWLKSAPESWIVALAGMDFKVSPTQFGHLGLFPEQKELWTWLANTIQEAVASTHHPLRVLNLFAYSGGATLFAAKAGAAVCHVDASKGMVAWAGENAKINGLEDRPIRWIVDDVRKFLHRQIRKGSRYDGIIIDPPTYGRGSQGQVFTWEKDVLNVLKSCRRLLSDTPLFFLLSSHTLYVTSLGLRHLLEQTIDSLKGSIDHGEMLSEGRKGVLPLSSGVFARWRHGA